MNREGIISILESMRTEENTSEVDELLNGLKALTDDFITKKLKQIGDSKEAIRAFLNSKIERLKFTKRDHIREKHTPINKMFTYGITGNSVHLHMPHDLRPLLAKNGIRGTVYLVNLYLLDAIDRIRTLKSSGFEKLKYVEKIYMISPILMGKEIKFLEDMDFATHTYTKKELSDPEFLKGNPEAVLGVALFGNENNVGAASIDIDTVNSPEWQAKKQEKIDKIAEKGITIDVEDIDIPE